MSSILSNLFLACLVCVATVNGQYYQATAKFWKYASGHLTFMNGHLWVELDVSNVSVGSNSLGIPDNCFDDGVYYHIHSKWEHDDQNDRQGTDDCGSDNTGGHWDPWFGCSDHSDGEDCQANTGCVSGSSVIEINEDYDCDTDSFEDYAYNCEVGDFSGKYGVLEVDSDNMIEFESSHWMEIDGVDIEDEEYSIVFHCSDESKTRAFCAPFNVTEMEEDSDFEREMGKDEAEIDFDGFETLGIDFDGTKITIGQGEVRVEMSSDATAACQNWFLDIHDKWEHSSSDPRNNSFCERKYIGGIWDPTHSCVDDSASIYCKEEDRCPNKTDTEVNYRCDNEDNALRCAIGDIDGRIGEIKPEDGEEYDETKSDRLSMHIDLLAGKSLLLECSSQSNIRSSGIYKVCKEIQKSDLKTSSSSSSNADDKFTFGGGFGIFVVIILVLAIGAGYWKGQQNEKANAAASGRGMVIGLPTGVTHTSDTTGMAAAQGATTMGVVAAGSDSPVPNGDGRTDTTVPSGEMVTPYNAVGNGNDTMNNNGNGNMAHGQDDDEAIQVSGRAEAPVETYNDTQNAPQHESQQQYETAQAAQAVQAAPVGAGLPAVSNYDDDGDDNANNNYETNEYNNEENDGGLATGNANDEYADDDDVLDDVVLPTNTVTKGGPALPPPPPNNTTAYNNDTHDGNTNDNPNDEREETPDQPMAEFEDAHGQLPVEELGDPKM